MTKIRMEILDEHIIYGDWDDVSNNQFMVYYHPNGNDCEVFMFSGQDYGGGITYHFKSKTKIVDNIIHQESKYVGDIKKSISNLPEAIEAKNKLGIIGY